MKLTRSRGHSPVNSEEDNTAAEKSAQEFREFIKQMRDVSRKANSQVSAPMDTAIVAGGAVGSNVKIIQSKTNDLHGQITSASSATEQITANTRHFNEMISKQDIAVAQTGSAIEEMSKSVNSVAEITRQKMEAADGLHKIIEKGGEDVRSTAKAIEEVTAAITAVADVIKVINSIAAQTNLLAMNAAIEAAHAGEAGRGFSVVAAEVRKLAESASANSKSIAVSLKNIIDQIRNAKAAGENAGVTYKSIQGEVDKFVGAFAEIAQSTSELSAGTKQIHSSMGDLQNVSSEISSGSSEIATGSHNIDASLRGIKEFSTLLVKDMAIIEEKIYDISGAQSGIAQFMVDTNKSIESFYKRMEESGELEKETQLINYDLIILMHRNWLIQLRAFLDGRKEGLKATPEDHLKCDLGRWIYGDGKQFQSNETYKTLESEHKNFHAQAGLIIQAKTEGNISLAEERYQGLMDDYNRVVSLLRKLGQDK